MKPKTCKISKGTSLKELANFFKLTEEQLKRYHNTYCPLEDLIGHDIPEHVTLIYVPPDDKELREKIFNPKGGNYIKYKSKNTLENNSSFNKRYGIIQKTFHNDAEKLKIHYETVVKKIGYSVEISRHPVYINHQRPKLIVEQIADKVGDILYPLKIETTENGIAKEISNLKEIQARWKQLKPDLEDYYKGKIAKELFERIEKQLKSKSQLLDKITDSIFYLMYFFPLYEKFNAKKYTFQLALPFIAQSEKVLFEVTLSLDETISTTNKFFIKAEGKCIDIRTPEEIDRGKFVPSNNIKDEEIFLNKGFFDFTYKLNSKDNSIFSIYGEMGIKLSDYTKKITFECYEQS